MQQWTEMPLWRTHAGVWNIDSSGAQDVGLRCRPLADTVAATWEWVESGGTPVAHPRWAEHGCSYQAISDTTCSATTIRNRRDEWIRLGVFARLKRIALESYDRIVGLVLDQIAVDGAITKAPGGGEVAGR